MNNDRHHNPIEPANPQLWRYSLNNRGTLLVYMVVVILIFGVLGVSLVSLFTTSTTSSATPNDAKRALFIAESGIRYALSEIRNSPDVYNAAELLNSTSEFKLGKNRSFTISVFSPGFKSAETKTIVGSGSLILDVPYGGKFPDDFLIPNVSVIDWLRFKENPIPSDSIAAFSSSTKADPPDSVTLDLTDDFDINLKDTVSFALLVTDAETNIPRGSSIYVAEDAKDFFPAEQGAIRIMNRTDNLYYDYFYESRVHEESNNRVALTNVREMPNATWQNIANLTTTDHVILSPYNFRLFASGKSDEITTEIGYNKPIWALSIPSEYTIYMRELLQDAQINQAGDVIRTQEGGDEKIELGRGSSGTEGFGDLWYGGEKPIGGNTSFCVEGRCFFDEGIRVYFTVDLTGDGEGFNFALISAGGDPPVNTALSAGGDFELSELLAYAGDSRLDTAGTSFVDKDDASLPRGLQPPKIALEFDTRTNLNVPLLYCQSASNLAPNSRNDPRPDNADKDVVQHVFWGNELLTIPCRGNNPLYDDNRHDAEGLLSLNWSFTAGGAISLGRPAIGADGTVYMSDTAGSLFAFNPDGTVKWTFILIDSNDYAPGIDRTGGPHDGTIYSDISGNSLVAINPDGTEKWRVDIGTDFDSTPAVGPDGSIYFGTDSGQIIKLNPDDRNLGLAFPNLTDGREWIFNTGDQVDNSPALSPDGSVVYAVSNDNNLYAVNTATGIEEWRFPILTEPNEINSSPTVNPSDGTIYVGADDNNVYAINPDGTENWRYATGNEVESTAGLDPNDGTIYIGSDDSKVHAINPDGTAKGLSWPFTTGGAVESSPIVRSDGTVFFGSGDSNVYAIDPNGIKLWEFSTGAAVPSSPALDRDGLIGEGLIFIGSNDNNLYALASLANPRNFRNTLPGFQRGFLTSENLDSEVVVDDVNNWLNGSSTQRGPWAIRMELERDSSTDQYVLLTWVRQCAQLDCTDVNGTLFQDTTVKYNYSPIPELPFTQTVTLAGTDDDKFERFLFGFTTAAKSGDDQLNVIRDFQLTFIRLSVDPVFNNDPDWTPP